MSYLKNQKIILIIIVTLTLLTSIFFISKNNEVKELPKVKLKEQQNLKQFALILEQDNGEYKESEGELPTAGYRFNKEKSGCTDVNGKKIDNALDYDYATYTVLLDTSKTIYCYLYYDQETIIEHLRNKDNKNQLSTNLVGGMYRYQGTNGVDNWICFGTSSQEECINNIDKYMYRIIGITPDEQLYLLKETFLKEGNTTGFAWNHEYLINGSTTYSCPNGVCPEWNEADLFQRINGTTNGTNAGAGNNSTKADTDIFVDSSYYDYLKSGDENGGEKASEWYNLIENHNWMYGDTSETNVNNINIYNSNYMYNIETGVATTTHNTKGEDGSVITQSYTWKNTVNAKISLMYAHDYLYAYPGGNPENYTNVANSWIHFKKDSYNVGQTYEWLGTRWGILTNTLGMNAWSISDVGALNSYIFGLYHDYGTRPVFYLSSNIELSGSGTKENPFIIPNL